MKAPKSFVSTESITGPQGFWLIWRRLRSRPAVRFLVANVCAILMAYWSFVVHSCHVITMPSYVDLGVVESGVTQHTSIQITNRSSMPIRCLGATEACGYGCFKSSNLPTTIEAGKSIEIPIEYNPPFPDALLRRGSSTDIITDEMIFYFEDERDSRRTLQIRCRIRNP